MALHSLTLTYKDNKSNIAELTACPPFPHLLVPKW